MDSGTPTMQNKVSINYFRKMAYKLKILAFDLRGRWLGEAPSWFLRYI